VRNLLDKRSAAEGHDRILVSGSPLFGIAVDEGDIARIAHSVNTAFQKTLILVLAVNDAGGSVLLDKGDGKELALGFSDQVVEFDLHGFGHWFGFYWFGFGKAIFCDERVNGEEDDEGGDRDDQAVKGEGEDGGDGGFLHLVWLVAGCGYGERLSVLGAPVNTIFELSFQKIGGFFAIHENAGSFVSIGKNHKWTGRCAESMKSEKRGFISFAVARLADGVACHGGDRVASAGGSCKNYFAFFQEKKAAHILLYA